MLSRLIPFYLIFLNRRHAKRREDVGKTAVLVDESMIAKNQMENSKAAEIEGRDNGGNGRARKTLEEDNAMQDMTDLKNEDFIYVY
jgi:hypothetical protein